MLYRILLITTCFGRNCDSNPMISGSHSPRHGVSSGCGYKKGLPYWR